MSKCARLIFSIAVATSFVTTSLSARAVTATFTNDSFKKIVRAPRAIPTDSEVAPVIVDENGKLVEESLPLSRPSVTVEPAPGTSTGHAPASVSEPVVTQPPPSEPATSPTPAATPSATVAPTNRSAETSLKWLTNGNIRFVKRTFRKDGRDASDRARLASGEKPHALILSCADSRVPAELVFDQGLGEILTVQNAGPSLDNSVIGTIESAVTRLGIRLIVVMSHTGCDGIQSATTDATNSLRSEAWDAVLADIRTRVKADDKAPERANVDGIVRDLPKRSAILAKKAEVGELTIKPATYDLTTGKITFN